jgi:type VII secretion-associated serine protease mycosin
VLSNQNRSLIKMTRVKRPLNRFATALLGLSIALSLFWPAALSASGQPNRANDLHSNITASFLRLPVAPDNSSYVRGELLVKLSDTAFVKPDGSGFAASSLALSQALDCFQLKLAEQVSPDTYKLTSTADLDVKAAASALQATGLVSYAGPNHVYHALNSPNDPEYVGQQQWGLTQIKAEQAWDVTTGSNGIVIAIVDTGTATDHPDLSDKIVQGFNFVNNSPNPYDDEGHGTYTAGIAAASTNNDLGVAGVSWGARIMPVKVLGSNGEGDDAVIARGIRFAVDNGARVINLSLGGDEQSPPMQDAVQYAADHNVLVVAAAGNTPDGKPKYPAAYPPVLAVGATGRNDTFTGFSSWGTNVGVTAPGVGVLSTGWRDGNLTYVYLNGTSASCPFVAGVAALVWSVNPLLTAEQVKWVIEDSSDDFGDAGWDEHYGYGRLNALRAVQLAQQGNPPAPAPHGTAVPSTPMPGPTNPPANGPTLQVDSTQVAPGALLAIVGAGFAPNEIINFTLLASDNNPLSIGSAETDGRGGFRAEVALPGNLPSGKAALTAVGAKSSLRASVELTVSPGAGNVAQSVVKGTVRGAAPGSVQVHLKPSLGVSGPEQVAQPDGDGVFTFAKLAAGI